MFINPELLLERALDSTPSFPRILFFPGQPFSFAPSIVHFALWSFLFPWKSIYFTEIFKRISIRQDPAHPDDAFTQFPRHPCPRFSFLAFVVRFVDLTGFPCLGSVELTQTSGSDVRVISSRDQLLGINCKAPFLLTSTHTSVFLYSSFLRLVGFPHTGCQCFFCAHPFFFTNNEMFKTCVFALHVTMVTPHP